MTHIEVLGPGCARCAALYERAKQAARELGLEYDIRKVTDIAAIARQVTGEEVPGSDAGDPPMPGLRGFRTSVSARVPNPCPGPEP
jgi:hypothetical protein